jgi:hypothetical protein
MSATTSRSTGKRTPSDGDTTVASVKSVQATNRDSKPTVTSGGIKREADQSRSTRGPAGDKAQVFTELPMRGWCASTAQFVRAGQCGNNWGRTGEVTLTYSGRACTATH